MGARHVVIVETSRQIRHNSLNLSIK